MSRILTFESEHGPIHFEVDESAGDGAGNGGLVPKGGATPMSESASTSDTRFEKAMSSLQAYAGSVQDIVNNLATTPKEATVEVGLTLKGEAGFFAIAKAGTEAEMRVKLSWEPKSKPQGDA